MFTPDIPENKYKVPLIQKSELPTYSFNKLVDMCEFNHIDEMDVHLGDKHGTRYCYVENVLKRPLELREFLMHFPAEDRNMSAMQALINNGGASFSNSRAPGLQQPIERQLMPALGNQLFNLVANQLNFIKYNYRSINWKYFTNCFYPGMVSWNRNYLPHMDPFSYAANFFLTDHPNAGTTFFRVKDTETDKYYYNMSEITSPTSKQNGVARRYMDNLVERYGYNEETTTFTDSNAIGKLSHCTVGKEPWPLFKGDDYYEGYLHLPSSFNTMSFYRGNRWHTASYDAQNEKDARYSLVAVIE